MESSDETLLRISEINFLVPQTASLDVRVIDGDAVSAYAQRGLRALLVWLCIHGQGQKIRFSRRLVGSTDKAQMVQASANLGNVCLGNKVLRHICFQHASKRRRLVEGGCKIDRE